jgi:hypothetical protein
LHLLLAARVFSVPLGILAYQWAARAQYPGEAAGGRAGDWATLRKPSQEQKVWWALGKEPGIEPK